MGDKKMRTEMEIIVTIGRLIKILIEEKDDFQAILRGHLLIERELEIILNINLVHPQILKLERKFFPEKLDLLVACGYMTLENSNPYRKLNSIRRQLAHDIDFELENINEIAFSIYSTFSKDQKRGIELIPFSSSLSTEYDFRKILIFLVVVLMLQSTLDENGNIGKPFPIENRFKELNRNVK